MRPSYRHDDAVAVRATALDSLPETGTLAARKTLALFEVPTPMKVLVIVPLVIPVDAPAAKHKDLYGADKALRREDLLRLALARIQTEKDVELPDADNEGVIFLDENEYELADELDDPQHSRGFKS